MHLTTSHERFTVSVPSSALWTSGAIIGAFLLIFMLDRATDSTPVQHLYYLPIILAARRFGTRGGAWAAVSAIVSYHVANPHLLSWRYEESDLVQMTLFLAVGLITAKLTLDANRLRALATTDDLTGLHNLRSFETRLATLVRVSHATRAPLALLVLDMDRLKSLNDEYGHLTGAEAVRTVGQIIGQRLPPGAVACRYGGDEFVIAIPRCTPFLAHRIADGVCRAVHDSAPVLAGRAFAIGSLSISVGGACLSFDGNASSAPWPGRDVDVGESLFRAADAALYRAKGRGRNQVCVA